MIMKCENCGRHEANYHYTSNINGKVTEHNLCSECAAKLGYEIDLFSDVDNMFEDMLGGFFGRSRRSRGLLSPFSGMDFGMPTMLMPRVDIMLENNEGEENVSAADPELKRARELNVLRAQMKTASDNEDFEKAAQIRDQIRKLEAEEKNGKTSE